MIGTANKNPMERKINLAYLRNSFRPRNKSDRRPTKVPDKIAMARVKV
jgi:hypothetical protein